MIVPELLNPEKVAVLSFSGSPWFTVTSKEVLFVSAVEKLMVAALSGAENSELQ